MPPLPSLPADNKPAPWWRDVAVVAVGVLFVLAMLGFAVAAGLWWLACAIVS